VELLIAHLRKEYRIAERMHSEPMKKRLLVVASEHGIEIAKVRGR